MEPKRWVIFRDTVSLLLGAGIVTHQELTGSVHWELLVIGLVLIGSPAALALVKLLVPSGGDGGTKPSSRPPES